MKKCKTCNIKQNIETNFYISHKYKNKPIYSSECKECSKKRTIEYGKKNKEKRRNAAIKHRYGITNKDYDELLEKQNNLCAICKSNLNSKRKFDIDHCHSSGKVRGLLCSLCNTGLGKFRDNIDFLNEAINYLRKNNV